MVWMLPVNRVAAAQPAALTPVTTKVTALATAMAVRASEAGS